MSLDRNKGDRSLPDEVPDEDCSYWEVKGFCIDDVLMQYPWKKKYLKYCDENHEKLNTWKVTRASDDLIAKMQTEKYLKNPKLMYMNGHWSRLIFKFKGTYYECRDDRFKDDIIAPSIGGSVEDREKLEAKRKSLKLIGRKVLESSGGSYGPPVLKCNSVLFHDECFNRVDEGKTTLPWIPYPPPMNIVDDDDCKVVVHSKKKKTLKKKKKSVGWKPDNGQRYKDLLRMHLMLGEMKKTHGPFWKKEARARLRFKITYKKTFPVSRGHFLRSRVMRLDPIIEDLSIMKYKEVRKSCGLKENGLNLSLDPVTRLC